jgi:hypothetical protein
MKSFLLHRSVRIVAALAVLFSLAGLADAVAMTTQASADPVSSSAYAGVGADVTQDLYNALAGASPAPPSGNVNFYLPIHSSSATNEETIQSFDAAPQGGTTLNPGCVTTKVGGPSFDRPNSTTAGIAALLDAINGTGWENSSGSCTNATVSVTGQIDFARAARGPKTTGSTLTFVPYGRDALGFLVLDPSHDLGATPALTSAQLTSLYSSSTGSITVGGETVFGCLTITGSTPRTNLESALSVSDATASTAATAAGCPQIQQNSGNSFYSFASTKASSGSSPAAVVIPISTGSWIGQANQVGFDRSNTARANGVTTLSIDSLGQPTTGAAPSEAPKTAYYQSTQYGYNVYTVLPTSKLSGFTQDQALESLFVGTSSALCQDQGKVNTYGFDSLTSAEGTCGSTTTTGNS